VAFHLAVSRLMRNCRVGGLGLLKQLKKSCCERCNLGYRPLVRYPPQGLSDDLVVALANRHILKCTLQVQTLGPLRPSRSILWARPP